MDSCTKESNISTFRVGYPTKDSAGNAITQPDGIQLEVQYPGTTDFAIAGQCTFPQDAIQWTHGPDGKYIFRARCFTYAVKGPGSCGGSCKRFGPASGNIAVTVHDARPDSPPNPVEMDDCSPCGTGFGAPSLIA